MAPKLYILTTTGQIPYLTKDSSHEINFTSGEKSTLIYQLRLADFLSHLPITEKFSSILNFISEENSDKKFHISLKPKDEEHPNSSCREKSKEAKSNKNKKDSTILNLSTVNGKRDLSQDEYYKILKKFGVFNDNLKGRITFDTYNDNDTIKASKKRLQKSAERTIEYYNEYETIFSTKEQEQGITVITGGTDWRRRMQCWTGQKQKLTKNNSARANQTILIENLEISEKLENSALEIYLKLSTDIPDNYKIVVSFAPSKCTENNLKIFKIMKKMYKIRKCDFMTSVFYDLSEDFVALKLVDDPEQTDMETNHSVVANVNNDNTKIEPPTKKRKISDPKHDDDVISEILNFKDIKYKFQTDDFLIDKYSYAYLHHLYDTSEYLGKALLVMFNLKQLVKFVRGLDDNK